MKNTVVQYNTVKSDAFTSNLLSYNSGTRQVSDVTGRSQSPYATRNLFAACANKKQSLTGSETFIIKPNLIWNNTTKTISQIQIDFADGQGFQSITIGTAISITYNDTGYKRWTIKATLSDNSVLRCYNDYFVLKASGAASRYAGNKTVIPYWGFVGVNKGARIYINYSRKNYTGTLRKPLIVVEGYDVSHIAPGLQSNYNVGDLIRGLNEPQGYDFNTQLDDVAGYDLVFIDFTDGAADIVDNAAIVQEVIDRVNANKVDDDRFGNIRQQNVVMGLSMGGLCARYALANMTKNFPGTPTETRLLITHDSPHRGANVPLGLQYFIRMAGNFKLFNYDVYDIYADYDEALSLLNAPATKELLYYRATTVNTYAANTFLDATYRPMITFSSNDPQPTYRFIATSLGSECAHPLFYPGKTFFNFGAGVGAGIDARLLFFRIPILSYNLSAQGSAYALPNQGTVAKLASMAVVNQLTLFGFINIYKQVYNGVAFSTGNEIAIDGVPGSNYPILDFEGLQKIQNLPIFSPIGISINFPIGTFLGAYFDLWAYNQGFSYDFTFVPTASALDAAPYTTPIFSQKYVNGANQNYPSTGATFIAQETNTSAGTTNNVHIRFTA